jgi:hypothetical protein
MRFIELGCFRLCSWCLWKALDKEGYMGLVNDVWTCGAKLLKYWMISSQKIKLNRSWKFQKNWNMPLVLLERSWWAGFNGIYLVRFGFRMWDILIFQVISVIENSNKFPKKNQVLKWFLQWRIQINSKKPSFGEEKSVEDVVTTLGPTAQATLVNMKLGL